MADSISYSQENTDVGKEEEKDSLLVGGSEYVQKQTKSEITQLLAFMLEQNERERRGRKQEVEERRRVDQQRWAEMLSSMTRTLTEPRRSFSPERLTLRVHQLPPMKEVDQDVTAFLEKFQYHMETIEVPRRL